MKYIAEKEFAVTYRPGSAQYELTEYYATNSLEKAIEMCRDRNQGCNILEVKKLHIVVRPTTKTITVNI